MTAGAFSLFHPARVAGVGELGLGAAGAQLVGAHRASDTLLIVLTDGELRWNDVQGDFSASSAVPASARGWLGAQPLWVDLRWAREEEHVPTRNPRFRDDVASLAAPIHGVRKDELVGEDARQHRRTIRLARAAVAILDARHRQRGRDRASVGSDDTQAAAPAHRPDQGGLRGRVQPGINEKIDERVAV